MHTRIKATLVALTVLAVAGCDSDPVATNDGQLPEALFGAWIWIQATGGIAGEVRTPDTEGFTRTLVFAAPNRVELLRDGRTKVSTTFDFVPVTEADGGVRSGQLLYTLPLMGFPKQSVLISVEGVLVLADPCCDGFTYEWRQAQ
jgi:hypothetical protein